MITNTLVNKFKKLVANQIISFEEYLKSLLNRIQVQQVKDRINEVYDQLRIFASKIAKMNDLKNIVRDYQTSMNETYITINNLLKVTIDTTLIEDKTIALYALDEIFNAAVLDVNAINNVLHQPPNHAFVMRHAYDLQAIFERYKQESHLKEFNRLLKKGDFPEFVNYLENDISELNIEELFSDVNVVYQIMTIIDGITTYWNTFCHLANSNQNYESSEGY